MPCHTINNFIWVANHKTLVLGAVIYIYIEARLARLARQPSK
jgi:hypothetical protein